MAESVTLTTPIVTTATVSGYSILSVSIQRAMFAYDWQLIIRYMDSMGNMAVDQHDGVLGGADVLVKSLNKANLSTTSLEHRALAHLISEGKIPASSYVGTPD